MCNLSVNESSFVTPADIFSSLHCPAYKLNNKKYLDMLLYMYILLYILFLNYKISCILNYERDQTYYKIKYNTPEYKVSLIP